MNMLKKVIVITSLSILAFILNQFTIGIIFGVDFILGSIPVLIAAVLFGPVGGIITALASSMSTYFIWNHFNAFPGFILEAVFMSIMFRKTKLNLVVIDIIYWFTLGIASVFIFYRLTGGMALRNVEMIGLKQAVNGIVNSVVVNLIFFLAAKIRPATHIDYKRFNSIENIFFSFIVAVIIFSLFAQLSYSSILNERRHTEAITDRLDAALSGIESTISIWADGYLILTDHVNSGNNPEAEYLSLLEDIPAVKYILITDTEGNIKNTYPKSDLFPDRTNLPDDRSIRVFSCTNLNKAMSDANFIAVTSVIDPSSDNSDLSVFLIDFEEIFDDLMELLANEGQNFKIAAGENEIAFLSLQPDSGIDLSKMFADAEAIENEDGIRIWYPDKKMPKIERRRKSVFLNIGEIKLTGWQIYAAESSEAMFNSIFIINTSYLKIISAFIIALSTFSLLLVSGITRPLKMLSEVINKLRENPDRNSALNWPETNINEIRSVSDYLKKLLLSRQQYISELRQSNQRLTTTLMSIGDGVIVTDADNRIVIINKIAINLTGWSKVEAVGVPVDDVLLLSSSDAAMLQSESSESFDRSEYILTSKNGNQFRIIGTSSPIIIENKVLGSIVVFRDETERIRQGNQLKNAQKMESIGLLAGGIAHDFNNLLTGVMSYADIIDARLEDDDQLKEYSTTILDTGEKAAGLVQQLLSFARKGSFIRTDVNLHEVIKKTVHLLDAGNAKGFKTETNLSSDEVSIRGDETMLQSMLLNLGVNAKDAMPGGGIISFSTEKTKLDADFCKTSTFPLTPGSFVLLKVADTGTGIPPENIEQIFEPFFTTKSTGKGVGLGLAAVYGTVQEMSGSITVSSSEDTGTTFSIYLPLIKT
ncbi:MAG TPA: hypothetical protein DCO79_10770 [Spirochaeta sp.]|nr:hypothetical protein [Spirochaeta sp.]